MSEGDYMEVDPVSEQGQTGYRKPPKSGRFKKGQSGNPSGRPRKEKAIALSDLTTKCHPTRAALRREAQRKVKFHDASGEREIPLVEAVLHSMSVTAMKGGILAQRTVLEYQMAEDEKQYQERKYTFEVCQKYKEVFQSDIEEARLEGYEREDILPHPEDIQLDHGTLTVRFLGAIDIHERVFERKVEQLQALAYEMTVFTGESSRYSNDAKHNGLIGYYMMMYLWARSLLPPRLRRSASQLEESFLTVALTNLNGWDAHLRKRCEAADLIYMTGPLPYFKMEALFSGKTLRGRPNIIWIDKPT